jgi:hypothetical protein
MALKTVTIRPVLENTLVKTSRVLPLLAEGLFQGVQHRITHLLGRHSCGAGFGNIGCARTCRQALTACSHISLCGA